MRRFTFAAMALALTIVSSTAAPAALAGNAHFIKNATGASLNGADLTCFFKEAGLESGSVENVACSAMAATSYECVNGGGHNPSASNKRTYRTAVSESGTFTVDRNGNIVGQLTLSPPTAEDLGFSCPSGQTVTFVGVSYSGISVADSTAGATASIPGTLSYRNPSAP